MRLQQQCHSGKRDFYCKLNYVIITGTDYDRSPAVIVPDNGDERFLNDAMNWGRDIRELLRQGSSSDEQEHTLAYVNYALGDEGPKSLYGDEDWRQERLIALKQRWDPHNVFGSYGPIPLE